jgi:hypothetical protein
MPAYHLRDDIQNAKERGKNISGMKALMRKNTVNVLDITFFFRSLSHPHILFRSLSFYFKKIHNICLFCSFALKEEKL